MAKVYAKDAPGYYQATSQDASKFGLLPERYIDESNIFASWIDKKVTLRKFIKFLREGAYETRWQRRRQYPRLGWRQW